MLEVCCGSYQDAIAAFQGGAKRIELNSALFMGGLTPSTACLSLVKQDLDLEVVAMVRPRAGGFCYSSAEYVQMMGEAEELLEAGADGLAFGFLLPNGSIDRKRTREVVELAHSAGKEAVFHRAFDCVSNVDEAVQILTGLGADRILTSGLAANVMQGMEMLIYLQKTYGDHIQIIAGSGVNAENIVRLREKTGLFQFHSSCKDWKEDVTTVSERVSFAYADEPNQRKYEVVSEDKVRELIDTLNYAKVCK